MRDNYKLAIYKSAYELALDIYRIDYPNKEKFGLEQQIRRASMSISLNIAEGCGKDSEIDFKRFLHVALGSLKETETLIDFSKDLDSIDVKTHNGFKERVKILGRQINNLIQKIKANC